MSDPRGPHETPRDLPPEYAEACHRGYARAFGSDGDSGGAPGGDVPNQARRAPWVPTQPTAGPSRESTAALPSLEHAFSAHAERSRAPRADRPAWFVPGLFGALVVGLVLSAFLAGKVLSSSVAGAHTAAPAPAGDLIPRGGADTGPTTTGHHRTVVGQRYAGATQAATVGRVGASCQAADAVDAGGRRVSYAPENVADGDPSTAWRCDGSGVGQTVSLDLSGAQRVGEVGLVPGYAKTDPVSGADRYAENNRITRVRWTFGDGSTVLQRLDGSAKDRSMQTIRVPVVRTGRVEVDVLATTRGPRNTTAISEIRIGRVAR